MENSASAPQSPTYTAADIAQRIGGVVEGDPSRVVHGVQGLDQAKASDLGYINQSPNADRARRSQAGVLVVPEDFPAMPDRTLIRVKEPRLAFTRAMHLFWKPAVLPAGIHRSAVVSSKARLGRQVAVGECAVIRDGVEIGDGTIVESGAHIGEGTRIGSQCFIGPNSVIRDGCTLGDRVILHSGVVIGADGFGFVWDGSAYLKIPQVGTVIIEDDVELGANVCVDRAAFGATVIGAGTKIDNLVQIAHNDIIGKNVVISGQAGLAGSVRVGDRVIIAGQVGIVDHITIGDGAIIGAGSKVIKSVPPGETVWWYPARPIKKVKRELAALGALPELVKRFREFAEAISKK